MACLVGLGGLALPFVLSALYRFPPWLAPAMFAMSALCFLIYGWDKFAARRQGERVPEDVMHLAAVIGGWPGALIAQQAFRHKTVKVSFRRMFWATVLVNLSAQTVLCSPFGQRLLANS